MVHEPARYEVQPDWNRRIIRAQLSGTWTIEADDAYVAELMTLVAETGLTSALIDHRGLIQTASWSEIFFRAEDNADKALQFAKIAFVYADDDPLVENPERYAFLATAFRNRGSTVEVFTDEDVALRWLAGGDVVGPR